MPASEFRRVNNRRHGSQRSFREINRCDIRVLPRSSIRSTSHIINMPVIDLETHFCTYYYDIVMFRLVFTLVKSTCFPYTNAVSLGGGRGEIISAVAWCAYEQCKRRLHFRFYNLTGVFLNEKLNFNLLHVQIT